MSRIGKKPIVVPSKVTVTLSGRVVLVKGPLGELAFTLPLGMKVSIAENLLKVAAPEKVTRQNRGYQGLVRTSIANMVEGVVNGYSKKLEISGVGYRAAQQGDKLTLTVGFSHPVVYDIPKGISIAIDKAQVKLEITGCDKALVGKVASELHGTKPPEPYKGKGIALVGKRIIRKVGKSGK